MIHFCFLQKGFSWCNSSFINQKQPGVFITDLLRWLLVVSWNTVMLKLWNETVGQAVVRFFTYILGGNFFFIQLFNMKLPCHNQMLNWNSYTLHGGGRIIAVVWTAEGKNIIFLRKIMSNRQNVILWQGFCVGARWPGWQRWEMQSVVLSICKISHLG